MVRVLAVADEEVPAMQSRTRDLRVDLVLAAGDLPWDYLERLASLIDAPAAFVPGNHDPVVGRGHRGPRGWTNLDTTVQSIGGLRIGGLGGCVRYNNGAHQYTQDQYRERADRLLTSAGLAGHTTIDVLLTHAPPLGLGDEPDPSHVGIEAVLGLIDQLQPAWHLHGHIHPYGMHKADRQLGSTTIRNVIPWQVIDIEPQSTSSTIPGSPEEAEV